MKLLNLPVQASKTTLNFTRSDRVCLGNTEKNSNN